MAVPTTGFVDFTDGSVTATDMNTADKRKGTPGLTGESAVSTGAGNELDFASVDISGGAANSAVRHVIWRVTADGGNTNVDTFLFWLSTNGFDQAGTVCNYQPVSGSDQGTPSLTENYVQSAVVGSYTWTQTPESEPGAINVYPTDEGSSMVLSTTADDAVVIANYVAVAASETTGTYKGTDSGYEFQFSFKYSYS